MEDEESPPEVDPWRMCRTCMTQENDKNKMCSLFDDDKASTRLSTMVSTCTGLQLEKSDGLPEHICGACLECVSRFYEFRCNAENANDVLRKVILRQHKSVKLEENVKIEYDEISSIPDPDVSDTDSESNKPIIMLERKVKKEKKHNCPICGKAFEKPSKLLRHKNVHLKEPKIAKECNICLKKFKNICHLKRHMIVHDEKARPFECPHCQRRFSRDSLLLIHIVAKHNLPNESGAASKEAVVKTELDINGCPNKNDTAADDETTCKHCNRSFSSVNSLSAHMRKHGVPGRVRACSVCGKVFKKTSHLKRHEHTHEDRRPYKCNQCTKSFGTEDKLQGHLNKHKGLKPHSCPVCAKSFAQRGTLTAHLRVHTRERPYLCPTCGKRFDSNTNLKQHMRRHAGEKAFACTLCPCRFVSKGELKSHMSTHTGARPFVCDACGASFTKPNSLVKHKLRHQGIKPHECDVCFMKFLGKEHLKRHYRIHTGEKPYKCDICERAFTQSNDLIKHKRAHLGDNLYKCEECSQSFRLKTELRNHISEHYISQRIAAGLPATMPELLALRPPEDAAAPTKITVSLTRDSEPILTVDKENFGIDSRLEKRTDRPKNLTSDVTVKKVKVN